MTAGSAGRFGQSPDIAIIGGGIIGCALAYELARNGLRVTVIERGAIGREASGASAGIISPPSAIDTPRPKAELTADSILAYPKFIERIEDGSGSRTGFLLRGELTVALTEEEAADLKALAAWQKGLRFHVEWLDGPGSRSLEPILPESVLGGVLVREAASVFSYDLTRVTALAARRLGVQIIEHTPAIGIAIEHGRANGVRLFDGLLPAGQVVLAAGAWSAQLASDLGSPIPTVPSKGQLIAIAGAPHMPRRILGRYGGGHIVPRTDGTVAVGATKERVGFDRRVVARNTQWCLDLASELAPSLLDGEVTSMWTGLRPGTPDDQPIIGRIPGYDGLWVATGHYHTGIQMAVITADLMSSSIIMGSPDPRLQSFSPARFGS
ncbi:MAG TPA: FAD-dependent oxidoreductase [Nitrolancea sp.]|nr:FAD-dependent oxidoreductase [Nitrolancea sp.]